MSRLGPVKLWTPPAALGEEPPADHFYASAVWLLRRHPKLYELADRAGVIVEDEDPPTGDLLEWLELDELAAALNALDAHRAAWDDYERRRPAPASEHAFDAWERNGPQHTDPHAALIAPMSRTEQTRLRLLAFLSSERVGLRVGDLGGLDDEGQQLVRDWCRAVAAA